MAKRIKHSDPEMDNIIRWLETEIDLCLACDLPSSHLEQQLQAMKELYHSSLPVSKYSH